METFDYHGQFQKIKDDAIEAFTKALNVEAKDTGRAIRVTKVWVEDSQHPADWEGQREAVRNDKTWGVPLMAALELYDSKSGKVLSQTKGMKIATIPAATDQGSFIVQGKHYQVYNQLRRRPGAYVTEGKDRDFKTDINTPGAPFKINFDDESKIFTLIKNDQKFALYPLLSRMGVSDSSMAKAWGESIWATNKASGAKRQEAVVRRAAKAFTGDAYASPGAAGDALKAYLSDKELAPEITKKTLGVAYSTVTPDLILHGAKELLRTHAGERQPDDRNALEYKKIKSVRDFIRERMLTDKGEIGRKLGDFRKKVENRLNDRSRAPTQISRVVDTGMFTGLFETFFMKTDLSHTAEQTNPIHILNGLSKVTIMGEGGVKSTHGISDHERAVHPSHLGFIDGIHTPDSSSIGVVTTLPAGVMKDGDELKTRVFDVKAKEHRYVSPREVRDLVMSFPDQFKNGKAIAPKVRAMVNGEMVMVDSKMVEVVLGSPKQTFSVASNTIPFLPSTQGVRAQMATKMLEQAIPLKNREAPLVQVTMGKDSIERTIGDGYSVKSGLDGVIDQVLANKIVVKDGDGKSHDHPIYNNLPLNFQAFLHADSRVKKGQTVAKGQLLADSNFTKDGVLAIGTNLRVAYIPYKGLNFEDGIVITESAAEKLSSEQMYQFGKDAGANVQFGLSKYTGWLPADLTPSQRANMSAGGVIKKGTIVKKGDALWVGIRENKSDPDALAMQRLLPGFKPFTPFKEVWQNDSDGEVIDVVHVGNKVKVYVKATEKAEIGDKLVNRYGAKGIITKIIPDAEAPFTKGKEDERIDIILNPHSITSRINPSQVLETAAAKIAKKSGLPYFVDNWSENDNVAKVEKDLAAAGLKDTELLFDPHLKEALGEVLVGPQYMLKIKQAKKAFSARSYGSYDVNQAPAKGGDEGSKAVDMLTVYSLLAHGARANLKEMSTFKATKNQQFWNWLQAGSSLGLSRPPPEPTFAYQKFEAYLKGAGVNIKRNGSQFIAAPMTDKDVTRLTSGEVKEPFFVRGKDLKAERGGLMDPAIFGIDKDKWGHYDLAEAMPNPVFEKPIQRLTNIKQKDYMKVVRGEMFLDPVTGKEVASGKGLTGGAAIESLLSRINVDADIKKWTSVAKEAADVALAQGMSDTTVLDDANKRLKYLSALKKLKLRPEEAYIQHRLPVLPVRFRPVTELPTGTLSTPGLNYLYRDLGLINNELKWQKTVSYIPESVRAELRQNLYDGAKALYGLGDPIANYQKERRPQGFIEQIKGDPAKKGFFQFEVLRRRQDLVGRGTIIPDPKLGIDEVALPEDMAWSIYKPFVIRRLVSGGMSPNEALDIFKTPGQKPLIARAALDAELKNRPVMLNRAPSLHKFSVMAFNPQITSGNAIKIPPLVVKGFNADFDGDAMTVHVPVLQDAVDEAKRMIPSKNLFNPGTGGVMISPQNEAALGLFMMTRDPAKREQVVGLLPETLREKYKAITLDKSGLRSLMTDLAKSTPKDFGSTVDKLKALGDRYTYESGFTVTLKDLRPDLPEKEAIFAATKASVANSKSSEESVGIIGKADKALDAILKRELPLQENNFALMVNSGARGNPNQLKQIVSAPFMVQDHRGNPSPIPIMKSFAQGLSFSDYWSTLYGARAVAVDKQLQTQEPGAFNKDIMATVTSNVISSNDCKTHAGIKLSVADQGRDVMDRFLSKDLRVGGEVIARAGEAVNANIMNLLNKHKVAQVEVRSPLTCRAPKGTCGKCYGIDEGGSVPQIGENVGAISGQALSEPLTQMTMRCTRSVVTYRYKGEVFQRSLEDVFAHVDGEIESVDGHETKKLKGFSLWDRHGWVKAEYIQRHMPTAPVHFLKTDTGDAILVQGDHPIFAYQLPACECGRVTPGAVRFESRNYTVLECTLCRRVRTYLKSEIMATERVVPVSDVRPKFDSLLVVKGMPSTRKKAPGYDPYVLGFYLAEGCIRRGDKGKYKGKPVATMWSQNSGPLKSHFEAAMKVAGMTFRSHGKHTAVYDTRISREIGELCPGLAHEKRMNFDVAFLPKEYLADLLAGMIDGDGTVAKRHDGVSYLKLYTSSFILAQQTSIICSLLELPYNITMGTMATKGKRHRAQPYVVEIRMDNNGKSTLRRSYKVAHGNFDGRLTYKNPTKHGPSTVTLNAPIKSEYSQFTYDIKTATGSFMGGFIRNHNTFHSGGLVGTRGVIEGYEKVDKLLKMPGIKRGKAVLSRVDGTAEKVTVAAGGVGHDVTIGGEKHFIPKDLFKADSVRVGSKFTKGDILSLGLVQPQELVKLKGLLHAEGYIADQIQDGFRSQDIYIKRRNIETVVRSVANTTRVIDPGDSDFIYGDVAPFNEVEDFNSRSLGKKHVRESIGHSLKNDTGGFKSGTQIDERVSKTLDRLGHKEIEVGPRPVVHEPFMTGITQIPMARGDWLSQMSYRDLKDAILDGAAEAQSSDIHGHSPIPGYAFGVEFGKDPGGKTKKEGVY